MKRVRRKHGTGWRPERRWIRGRWIPVTIGEKCRTPEEGEENCYAWGLKHQCAHAAEEPSALCPHHLRMDASRVRSNPLMEKKK